MALFMDGVEIPLDGAVIMDGVSVETVIMDGVEVWKKLAFNQVTGFWVFTSPGSVVSEAKMTYANLDGTVPSWSVSYEAPGAVNAGHQAHGVCFDRPWAAITLSGSDSGFQPKGAELRTVNTSTGASTLVFADPLNQVGYVLVTPAGGKLCRVSLDVLYIYEIETGTLLHSMPVPYSGDLKPAGMYNAYLSDATNQVVHIDLTTYVISPATTHLNRRVAVNSSENRYISSDVNNMQTADESGAVILNTALAGISVDTAIIPFSTVTLASVAVYPAVPVDYHWIDIDTHATVGAVVPYVGFTTPYLFTPTPGVYKSTRQGSTIDTVTPLLTAGALTPIPAGWALAPCDYGGAI